LLPPFLESSSRWVRSVGRRKRLGEGCGGIGWNLSRHPTLLRSSGSPGCEYVQSRRRGKRLPQRATRVYLLIFEGKRSYHGCGSRTPRYPRSRSALFPGNRKSLPRRRRAGNKCCRRIGVNKKSENIRGE